jgi:hypothetical protein
VKEWVFAVTPTGGQIETTAGVNLSQYYACFYGGQNNPGCSGYTPQPPTGYGYLHNQAANVFVSGLKVDGALTLWGPGEVAGQASRNGTSQQLSVWISPALSGTPLPHDGIHSDQAGQSVHRTGTVDGNRTSAATGQAGRVAGQAGFCPGGISQMTE